MSAPPQKCSNQHCLFPLALNHRHSPLCTLLYIFGYICTQEVHVRLVAAYMQASHAGSGEAWM